MLGGNIVDVDLPYEQCTVTCSGNDAVKNSSVRPTFEYNGQYYRVDEVCFSDKPFIVIEYGTYDELTKVTIIIIKISKNIIGNNISIILNITILLSCVTFALSLNRIQITIKYYSRNHRPFQVWTTSTILTTL